MPVTLAGPRSYYNSKGAAVPVYDTVISASASGYNEIVPAASGKSIVLLRYTLVVAGNVTITWQSGDGTTHSGSMAYATNGGIVEPFNPNGYFKSTLGYGLGINLGSSVAVAGHLQYAFE